MTLNEGDQIEEDYIDLDTTDNYKYNFKHIEDLYSEDYTEHQDNQITPLYLK